MLREKPTPAMVALWKKTFAEYKNILKPNRKTGQEMVDYLLSKYELVPFHSDRANEVIVGNVMKNEHFREKLPVGEQPRPVTFRWMHHKKDVFIGVDLASGMFHIEDDESLWDELCAFQGLDESDLQNCFCVYEYISCLKKFGKLETILYHC